MVGPVVRARGVRYAVGGRVLLDGAGLDVPAGGSVAVSGPSGSGKSTLLMCLLGLVRPDAGEIAVAGADVTRMSRRALAEHRRRTMGMVFQFGELLPELTPVENAALPALLGGTGRRAAYAAARELLVRLGVPVEGTATGLLSGGERQRVAVARALAAGPAVVLADEPTGALDAEAREAVADLLFALPAEHGCALVVATHDPAVAARADERLVLRGGRLSAEAAA
ncbi:ABC transporter ATP-binding protein [Actinomadura parmotrematis]|uniref:ATP-binding cassette domain-containing protein n=1 Tax=Actinomadura parmotrematis TaxID=2864039 RepID=A0ABS7FLM3_9ACTN|nr:ATP-binding cassette domain-containing protein [Actinomadura parmotrematis]MBW8481282.1 ATP-binding cassette domain-containing protein [Actinomadura parmotrematis]